MNHRGKKRGKGVESAYLVDVRLVITPRVGRALETLGDRVTKLQAALVARACTEVFALDTGDEAEVVPQRAAADIVLNEEVVAHVWVLGSLEDSATQAAVDGCAGFKGTLCWLLTTIPVHVRDGVGAVVCDSELVGCCGGPREDIKLRSDDVLHWHAYRPRDVAAPAGLVNCFDFCAGHAGERVALGAHVAMLDVAVRCCQDRSGQKE